MGSKLLQVSIYTANVCNFRKSFGSPGIYFVGFLIWGLLQHLQLKFGHNIFFYFIAADNWHLLISCIHLRCTFGHRYVFRIFKYRVKTCINKPSSQVLFFQRLFKSKCSFPFNDCPLLIANCQVYFTYLQ